MINRENYEIYALDYLEGNLNNDLKKQFEEFLKQNPDIAQEIFNIDLTPVKQDTSIEFKDKNSLKKSSVPGLSYFDELCIAELEGISTKQQKQELKHLISTDKEKEKIFIEYQLTKVPLVNAFYPYKDKLRKSAFSDSLYKVTRIAAIILIFFSLLTLTKYPKQLSPMAIKSTPGIIMQTATGAASPTFDFVNRQPVIVQKAHLKTATEQYKKQEIKITQQETDTFESPFIQPRTITINWQADTALIFDYPVNTINSSQEDILNLLTEKALETFKNQTTKRGIIISKDEFRVKINDKTYGICWR